MDILKSKCSSTEEKRFTENTSIARGARTRKALAQRQHCGRSCRGSCKRCADNSSAHVQEVISSESETVPQQSLKPSLPDGLLDHIYQHQHLPSVSLKHHLPLPKDETGSQLGRSIKHSLLFTWKVKEWGKNMQSHKNKMTKEKYVKVFVSFCAIRHFHLYMHR